METLKNKKLNKEIFCEIHDNKILKENLSRIFPSKNVIEIYNRILHEWDKSSDGFYYAKDSLVLPKHTRDTQWLSYYIQGIISASEEVRENGDSVKNKNIISFIENYKEFAQERNRYENDVIYVEIQNMITSQIYGPKKALNKNDKKNQQIDTCETFREKFIHKMTTDYHFDQHQVETCLEKNSYLWLDQVMDLEFINVFLRPLISKRKTVNFEQYLEIVNKVISMRAEWAMIRRYQYYRQHNEIINKLNLSRPEMKFKPEEIIEKGNVWKNEYFSTIEPMFERQNDLVYEFTIQK